MKALSIAMASMLCAGCAFAGIAGAAMPQAAPGGKNGAGWQQERTMPSRGALSPRGCPLDLKDYMWLDYSRMGMWRRSGGQNGQNGQRMSRRTRILHLKHNGFPPRESGGCPSCQGRAGGMKRWRGEAGMTSAMKANGRRGAEKRDEKPDPALKKAVLWLETPDNRIHRIEPGRPGVMRFNARLWGMYRIFAYLDAGENGGVHRRHFAFYEMFSHGDEADTAERPVLNEGGYWRGRPEFFLERIYGGERQRYATRTGDVVRFRVSLRGRPVRDVCVVMITQKGWRKAARTDEKGEVSFFVIKETPTESGWRARRRSGKYLVAVRHLAEAGQGEQRKTLYTATTVLRVRPSRLEWESKSAAFLLASFTVIATGAAIAIRRSCRRGKRSGRKA